jgi:hypothetical protein
VSDRISTTPPAPSGQVKEPDVGAPAEESTAAVRQVELARAAIVVRGAACPASEGAVDKVEFLNFATAPKVRSLRTEEETR